VAPTALEPAVGGLVLSFREGGRAWWPATIQKNLLTQPQPLLVLKGRLGPMAQAKALKMASTGSLPVHKDSLHQATG
jgi:hypothetical protein